jgi:alkylation response protein AidB-like acyl-CoA dehydrogenase
MDMAFIDAAAKLFAAEASEARLRAARDGQPVDGWDVLEAAGLHLAAVPEQEGGLGLDPATMLGIARAHGAAGGPWPLAEALAAGDDLALAALKTAEIAGALESVLAMTLAWTQTREQFGKPLSRNQAVQHELAKLAGEVAAAGAAVGLAAQGLALGKPLAIAAAKARASEAAGQGAAIAHQLHGAIGVTAEHRLNLFTRALWQWRDAVGSEFHWQAVLGRAALAAGSVWQVATA